MLLVRAAGTQVGVFVSAGRRSEPGFARQGLEDDKGGV